MTRDALSARGERWLPIRGYGPAYDVSDLDVVIVSHGDARWLRPCLASLDRNSGGCDYRVVVVENGTTLDEHHPEVREAPNVTLVLSRNRGFAAGNNLGVEHTTAPTLFFLNPDTELVNGTLADLVRAFERLPRAGALAVRQITADGATHPTLRRFPGVGRALANALWAERWPVIGPRAGERELRKDRYDREAPCDWTTGAALVVRRDTLRSTGGFDARFFLFSEETDLCRRLVDGGHEIVHLPTVTVVHHAGKAGVNPTLEAQMAYSRLQYARKHFGPLRRAAYRAVLVFHHGMRFTLLRFRSTTTSSADASMRALRVLLRCERPPFEALTSPIANSGRADELESGR
jgi:GT2 family glycosyltransferase